MVLDSNLILSGTFMGSLIFDDSLVFKAHEF